MITVIRTPEHVSQNTKESRKLEDIHFRYLQSLAEQDWKAIMEEMEQQG
ncbi:MAG: hypothetical protein ACJ749_11155 [Flavisolibacter sp.]